MQIRSGMLFTSSAARPSEQWLHGLKLHLKRCRAVRSLHFSGATGVEGAVAWIMEHESDADLDDLLLVPKARLILGSDPGQPGF